MDTRAKHDPERYDRAPGVIATDLESEVILLDPASQAMFSLDPVGRQIWQLLSGATTEEVVANLVAAFDVTPERADADVRALLRQLTDAGLIVVD